MLEDLLERVRRDEGPAARIVAANRIRTGGVAGFFAREGFEVIVEKAAAEPARAPREPRSARVPASVLDLADAVSSSEREQVIDLSSEQPFDAAEAATRPETAAMSHERARMEHRMAEAMSDRPSARPTVSTERSDFGSMLAQLTRELDEDGFDDAPARPIASTRTPVIDLEDGPVSPASHYRRVTTEAPVISAPVPAASPARDPRLLALGLPADFVPTAAANGELRTALVQRLAQLPAPPALPRSPGVVVAVVGIGTAPIALARRLADELDVDPEHIVLATPEPVSELSHPDEAQASRRSWRRRAEPTIVACSIGPGRAQLGWAHRILDRLEPTITWAVVEASCKPDDIEHRVSLLGGVDVLALTGVADTVSPASVLRLGIPVGRIGAKPATPAVWADVLIERLER